jgi:hypothetical protein
MAKLGRAAIGWSSTEDSNTERIHLLDAPLRELMPGHALSVYRSESLDKTNVQTYSVGNGAYELEGKVRFDANPQSLIDVVKAGSQGKTLTYYPNLSDPDTAFACTLIAPMSPSQVGLDPERGVHGDAEITLRLRKTDETPFTPITRGTNVLFFYRAGDSLAQATFARADGATYVSKGLGALSTAASGKARLTWISTAGSTGVRNTPALLLERAQTNRVTWSEKLSTWTGTATLSSAQTDPKGGTAAWLVSDTSTTAQQTRSLNITLTSSTRWGVSCYMRQGTTASTAGVQFRTRDAVTGALRSAFTATWSSGKPTVTVNTGSSWEAPTAHRGGWWRFSQRTTTSVSTANALTVTISPTGSTAAAVGNKGNVYFYGAQVE